MCFDEWRKSKLGRFKPHGWMFDILLPYVQVYVHVYVYIHVYVYVYVYVHVSVRVYVYGFGIPLDTIQYYSVMSIIAW